MVADSPAFALTESSVGGDAMPNENGGCELHWGDRVDHRLFGLGTVNGAPEARVGPTASGHGIEDKGWSVPVKWDDESRYDSRVMSHALRLASRPNAKGGAYWHAEYVKLADASTKTTQAVEFAIKAAYRHPEGCGLSNLNAALRADAESKAALVKFLEADEGGEHA